MKAVSHVDVTEVEKLLGILYFLQWVGYSISGAFNVFIYFTVVTTQTYIWGSSFGSNDQW